MLTLLALGGALLRQGPGNGGLSNVGLGNWPSLLDLLLSVGVLSLWTALLAPWLRGQPVLTTDPRRRLLGLLYPWLIAYEGALWLTFALAALSGGLPQAQSPALLALVTVWGASIGVSLLIFLQSLRLLPNPADRTGRLQLAETLNLAAALSAAGTVMNLVPLAGLGPRDGLELGATALAGAAELASLLLLRRALLRPVD